MNLIYLMFNTMLIIQMCLIQKRCFLNKNKKMCQAHLVSDFSIDTSWKIAHH